MGHQANVKRARRTARYLFEPQDRGQNDRSPDRHRHLIRALVERDLRRAQEYLDRFRNAQMVPA